MIPSVQPSVSCGNDRLPSEASESAGNLDQAVQNPRVGESRGERKDQGRAGTTGDVLREFEAEG